MRTFRASARIGAPTGVPDARRLCVRWGGGPSLRKRGLLGMTSLQFIDSILALKPPLAVFDCDGTLWSGDAGADFFYWEIERGIVGREVGERAFAHYEEYKAGRVSEEQICGEMVTMNCGVSQEALLQAGREFFEQIVSHRVFPEMQELTRRLDRKRVV